MHSLWCGAAALLASAALTGAVMAGPLDGLEGALGGGSPLAGSSGIGGDVLGALGSGSFQPLSLGNVAGVLSFCEKQGFAGGASDMVKQQLLARLGVAPERDAGYRDGLGGLLQGKDGTDFTLDGLKKEAGREVCSALAKRALSVALGL